MEEAYLAARRALDRIDDTGVEYANDGGSEWVLGALINVVGNVLINLGTNVVKMGHNHDEQTARLGATSGRGRGCLLRSGGWLLFVVGSAMNFVSFSFAAQSLLAALGAVQFVSNAVFAKYCLGEAVSRRTILATGGIVFGILLVISSASHRNAVHTVEELLDLYVAPAYRAPTALSFPPPTARRAHGARLTARRMRGHCSALLAGLAVRRAGVALGLHQAAAQAHLLDHDGALPLPTLRRPRDAVRPRAPGAGGGRHAGQAEGGRAAGFRGHPGDRADGGALASAPAPAP